MDNQQTSLPLQNCPKDIIRRSQQDGQVDLERIKGELTLDSMIEIMAHQPIANVTARQEETDRRFIVAMNKELGTNSAGSLFVCRIFTDAVFNEDIRCIQTIINRLDGGLPKDSEIGLYKSYFSECIRDLLSQPEELRFAVNPNDSVMMAIAKSLYNIACEDIYYDYEKDRKVRPSDTKKQLRDNAMRMILERSGGRKTKVEIQEEAEEVVLPAWLEKSLPDV